MRVVHVAGSLQCGGAERWVRELVPRLGRRGLDMHVVSVYPPRLGPADLALLECPVHHVAKRPGFQAGYFWWLTNTLRSLRPAIVHTHQHAGKYWGRACALAAGVTTIVHTEHDPHPRLTPLQRMLCEPLWRTTNVTIAFSERNAAFIRQREPVARIEIIANGLSAGRPPSARERAQARFELGAGPNAFAVGAVASLQQRKNHSLALESVALAHRRAGPDVELHVFGDGPLRDELAGYAASLGIAAYVRFHGFRDDVRRLLPGLDAVLTTAFHEMAPISILEAMAAELPVIGTPHFGTLDMVEDGASGTIAGWDAREVAAGVVTLAGDRERARQLGKRGRDIVLERYDIETLADQHIALYREFAGATQMEPSLA